MPFVQDEIMAPPGRKENEICSKYNRVSKETNKGVRAMRKKCGIGLQRIVNRRGNHDRKCYPERYPPPAATSPLPWAIC